MSGRPFRRTAMPCARDRWAYAVVVVSLALAAFVLSCVGSPPGEGARRAGPAFTGPVFSGAATAGASVVAARADHAEHDPCEEGPGHDCHSSDPRAVLGHAPLPGADHSTVPWQPATGPAVSALDPARAPGRARPPDLHVLQLLRV
ncbi:hypothetical protein [Streptomyces neyagawaensis]|uniref:hypothetical protein n=1 Tax=Streptomyces neyagawaensis TaxID=42238 RepID=UPI0006E120CC|nr:hypothetical protein [Streptomyces neyagawaensis]MCL6732452.1 hypothetical protein [Streptomyces neyagawaensis]MDE1687090.1 hypothetical protein [Streptomyces neyagawaensis]